MNSEPLQAVDVPALSRKTIYLAPFSAQVEGRIKHRLGDHFTLANFGINLTELEPGAVSALFHQRYLEIGDRTPGDYAEYPRDDLKFTQLETGAWVLTHKDGTSY